MIIGIELQHSAQERFGGLGLPGHFVARGHVVERAAVRAIYLNRALEVGDGAWRISIQARLG